LAQLNYLIEDSSRQAGDGDVDIIDMLQQRTQTRDGIMKLI